MKLGISVFFDPTVGTIRSDFLFLNGLVEHLKATDVTFVAVMKRTKGLVESFASELKFKYDIVPSDEAGDFDAIVTWNNTNLTNFFGGKVSATYMRQYLFLAKHSAKGVPIYMRCGDSENEVGDYRYSISKRLAHETSKGRTDFAESNADQIKLLDNSPVINYNNFYLLVNGERDKFDWVEDSYRVRMGKQHTHFTPNAIKNAMYLGDEMFFQVLKHKAAYEKIKKPVRVRDHLYWIGFIEYRNSGRKEVFNHLFETPPEFPMVIQTPTPFELDGVDVVNERIVGDTPAYFKHLGEALGYVFIGKGTPRCAYINKTVYDCFIAGTPVLVYAPIDQGKMIFPDLPECYFSSQDELQSLYRKLQDKSYRDQLVKKQAKCLTRRLMK